MADSQEFESKGGGRRARRSVATEASSKVRAVAEMNSIDRSDPRRRLAAKLNDLVSEAGMSQRRAAEHLGIPQPKISAIQNYRLHGISLERLIAALVKLDHSVVITVAPLKRRRKPVQVIVA